ncbi:MAG: heme-binding domain-containing protein [Melioribacter sp.]|nr:heme-binding domain-containing protein [Melioribacter sp.]
MRIIIKVFIYMAILFFIAIQFIKVDRSNPRVTADINASSELKSILKNSCYDCHSNETKWPWYSYIAPISFLIVNDVNEGRKELNFSEWENYDSSRKLKLKNEIWEEVEKGRMPLRFYTFLHPNSNIDYMKKQVIKKWVKGY